MTNEDQARLEEIRGREREATPGPWLTPNEIGNPYSVKIIDHEGCYVWPWSRSEDMEFAYAAREDVPWLLDRIADLERERDAAQQTTAALREALVSGVVERQSKTKRPDGATNTHWERGPAFDRPADENGHRELIILDGRVYANVLAALAAAPGDA